MNGIPPGWEALDVRQALRDLTPGQIAVLLVCALVVLTDCGRVWL